MCWSALEDAPLADPSTELAVLRGFHIAGIGHGEAQTDLHRVENLLL